MLDKEDCFCSLGFKNLPHCMHNCFTSRYLTCTYLKRTRCFLDVFSNGDCYGFTNDPPSCLPNAYGTHSWTLVQSYYGLQSTKADIPARIYETSAESSGNAVRLSHSSEEADLNEVQGHFHAAASRPDGPAAPSILRTVLCISWPSICSKMMEWAH